jgi:aspartyl-tRNA(Asn)/glutamyl-tRNA(Gln) amidotransferase subunit A
MSTGSAGVPRVASTVREALNRIREMADHLNAFSWIEDEPQSAPKPGILSGVPVAVKDLLAVAGKPLRAGSPLYRDLLPTRTCRTAQRLRDAGAVLVAGTQLHELAYGITSSNPHFGPVRNPHDPTRIPGGSSGGSGAAVACGAVPIAIGSDTGGSIRIPASFCGVVGIKPTFGLVSLEDVIPLGFTLDHLGPLAATVRYAALALEAMAEGPKAGRYATDLSPNAKFRVGVPSNFFFDQVDPEVQQAVKNVATVLQAGGASVEFVEVPDMEGINATARVILLSEASAQYAPYLKDHSATRPLFGDDVYALIAQGTAIPATAYVNAQRLRRHYQEEFARVFDHIDLLLTPTTPTAAPRIGERTIEIEGVTQDVRIASTRLVRGINLLGLPAISIPCGFTSEGLPIGAQLIARPFADQDLLNAAAYVEQYLQPAESGSDGNKV